MKTLKPYIMGLFVCVTSSCLLLFGNPQSSPQSSNDTPLDFRGVIMDSTCAMLGSHNYEMHNKGLEDTRTCVLECLKDGGKLVLYGPGTGIIYALDTSDPLFDRDRLTEFAGETVRIVGSFDEKSNRIRHIQSIERI